MPHSFSITIPDNTTVQEVYQSAFLKIHNADGYLQGDTKSGSFSLKGVEGNYAIYNKRIDITLSRKPFLVTFKYVESKVREYFK